MVKGFVFGKFLPFHKGHAAMVAFAMANCDFLSILVCSSDKEEVDGNTRKQWIETLFPPSAKIEVLVYDYKEDELANSSVASLDISAQWSEVFKQLFPDYTVLVTSEPYGDMVARFMGISHIPFDMEKEQYPVSSTQIKNNPLAYWKYLPVHIKPYYVKKVVVLGTESTGKTTLTEQLALHFNGLAVMEAARDIIDNSNHFSIDDLYAVANTHAQRITKAIDDSPLLFIDTDVHITQSYAQNMFGVQLQLGAGVYNTNRAGLYIYLKNDVGFIQDGTRLHVETRNEMDISHRATLQKYNVHFEEIGGSWDERFNTAVGLVNAYILNKL